MQGQRAARNKERNETCKKRKREKGKGRRTRKDGEKRRKTRRQEASQ